MLINLLKKINTKQKTELHEIALQISNTRNEIDITINNFNCADSDELIDIYTYKLKVLYSTYEYLLKRIGKYKLISASDTRKNRIKENLVDESLGFMNIKQTC